MAVGDYRAGLNLINIYNLDAVSFEKGLNTISQKRFEMSTRSAAIWLFSKKHYAGILEKNMLYRLASENSVS
ncbi:MAG: hypothetical protein WCL50_07920 [Spirochaetota bacterium]